MPAAWVRRALSVVRRRLAHDAAVSGSPVTTEDLTRFAGTFGDLAEPDVMSQAWQ